MKRLRYLPGGVIAAVSVFGAAFIGGSLFGGTFGALQGFAQSPESDALYDKGMKLYDAGDFNAAAKAFRECWELDSVTLDPSSCRYESAKELLASALYRAGKENEAKALNMAGYDLPPFDRRITKEADNILQEAFDYMYDGSDIMAMVKMEMAYDEYEKIYGKSDIRTALTAANIAGFALNMNDLKQAIAYNGKAQDIMKNIKSSNPYVDGISDIVKGIEVLNANQPEKAFEYAEKAAAELDSYIFSVSYIYGKMLDLYFGSCIAINDMDSFRKMMSHAVGALEKAPESQTGTSLNLLWSIIQAQQNMPYPDYEDIDRNIGKFIDLIQKYTETTGQPGDGSMSNALSARAFNALSSGDNESAVRYADACTDIVLNKLGMGKESLLDVYSTKAAALYGLQQYDAAISLADEIIGIASSLNYIRDYVLMQTYKIRGMALRDKGKTAEAAESMVAGLRNFEKSPEINLYDLGTYYLAISGLYSWINEFEKCYDYASKAVKAFEKAGGQLDFQDYFTACIAMIDMRPDSRDNSAMLENLDRILQSTATPENAQFHALLQSSVASCRSRMAGRAGNNEEAYNRAKEAMEILENAGLEVNESMLNVMAVASSNVGQTNQAIDYSKKRLELLRRDFGKNSPSYLQQLYDLSSLYMDSGKLTEVEAVLDEMSSLMTGDTSSFTLDQQIQYLEDAAIGYLTIMQPSKAYDLTEFILKKNPDIANNKALSSQWNIVRIKVLMDMGMTEEGLGIANEILKRSASKDLTKGDSFFMISEVAAALMKAGRYSESKSLFEKAFAMLEPEDYGNMKYIIANAILPYSQILTQTGDLEKATELSSIFLDIVRDMSGNIEMLSTILSTLETAYAFTEDDDMQGALQSIREATARIKETEGENSMIYQQYFKTLIQSLLGAGEYQEAMDSGLDYCRRMRGEKRPVQFELLRMLSERFLNSGKYDIALELISDIDNNISARPTVVENVAMLALKGKINSALGNYDKSLENYELAFGSARDFVLQNFLTMTTRERTHFWNQTINFFKEDIPLAARKASDIKGFPELAYNSALFSTSLLLASDKTVEDAVAESKDKKIKNIYFQFNRDRNLYQQVLENQQKSGNADADACKNLEEMRLKAEASEKALLSALKNKLGNYNSQLAVKWEDVRNALGEREAAVEFMEFLVDDDCAVYTAVALRKDMPGPQIRELFIKHPNFNPFDNCYDTSALTEALWKPLADILEGCDIVWFAPQGQLSVTAIESLPEIDKIGSGNPISFRRVTSTRQLALSDKERKAPSAVIYGGINYKTDAATLGRDAEKYPEVSRSATREIPVFQESDFITADLDGNRDAERAIVGISALPGTRREAEMLSGILESIKNKPKMLLDSDGTEASFKAMSGKAPSLLHIGTHGFYFNDKQAGKLKYFRGTGSGELPPEDLAMKRSGLLFAGAENSLYGKVELPEGVEDGVLTASEIASLDLSGIDLTVLSACETALGKISADGVFGLQRGFKKSGAGALLMTLWKVDDEATSILMERFYSNWLIGGMNEYEALESARRTLRESEQWNQPRFWAPFILLDAMR